jgi:hypothetical protein
MSCNLMKYNIFSVPSVVNGIREIMEGGSESTVLICAA